MTTKLTQTARVFVIGTSEVKEYPVEAIDDIAKVVGQTPLIWVDFDGPIDQTSLKELGELFELHPLSLEDVVKSKQRAKVEHYPKYHFVVTPMVSLGERLQCEQLSIFFGRNFVLTFQEKEGGDSLEPMRKSLRRGGDALAHYTPDYLAYAIIDTVVDGYFPVIKELGDRLNDLEEEIFKRFDQNHSVRIHAIKRDIWTLRQTIWPVRDALTVLLRDSLTLVANETRYYLRDCYDHSIRIIEMVESHISMCADLMDLHMSRENSRMNEILRVLTIISTLFIPPTFIAGIYGMNFNSDKSPLNMPELGWYFGYPMALGIMAVMMGGLVVWMWWKGWLNGIPRGKRFRLTSRREREELK